MKKPLTMDCRLPALLTRPLTWIRRFRHRHGYGVHSPFAFEYITQVIYENAPYYKYKELDALQRQLAPEKGKPWARQESRKLKRLLFRMVNHAQPATIIDVGPASAASLYLKAAKEDAGYLSASGPDELFLEKDVPVDFLYLHDRHRPELLWQAFEVCAPRTRADSVFVVRDIHASKQMKRLWSAMKQHARTGITFDLYDVGILLFDRTKNKQDYIVNFP